MSIEPDDEYKFSRNPEGLVFAHNEYRELHEAERALKKARDDRELRRWCIEQVAIRSDIISACHMVQEAEKLYDWVRNKSKADAA